MWTLTYKSETKTLAQWGIAQLKRTRVSQGEDTVLLREGYRSLEEPALFDAQASIAIFRDGEPWFRGCVTQLPAWGHAQEEARQYEISGPWWSLQNLVYQQSWIQGEDADEEAHTVESGHIILGLNEQGERIHTGAQLRAILKYAQACGAPFEIGQVLKGVAFPLVEAKDMTCAEALRRVLRWHPDAVSWVDYSQLKPVLHICTQAQLEEACVDLSSDPRVEAVRLNPREAGRVSEVVICYEEMTQKGQGFRRRIERDAYPRGATGKQPKALVLTIPLEAPNVSRLSQSIQTQPIEAQRVEWWQAHLPFLKNIPADRILVEAPEQPKHLTRELVQGQIAPWMQVRAERVWIRALLSWESAKERVVRRDVRIELTATDADQDTYTQTTVQRVDEPTQKGLARKLYESLHPVQYTGHLTLIDPELPSTWTPGRRLILDGGPEPDIEVLIQSVSENLSTGRVTLTFGAPKHLGARDLITLLQLNRQREVPTDLIWRLAQAIEAAQPGPVPATHLTPCHNLQMGLASYSKLLLEDPQRDPKRNIEINLEDLPKHLGNIPVKVRFRRLIHFNGKERYLTYVLSSQDIPIDDA